MKKYLKGFAILALVVFTLTFAFLEIRDRGTITGRTLVPVLIGLIWYAYSVISRDVKEMFFPNEVKK